MSILRSLLLALVLAVPAAAPAAAQTPYFRFTFSTFDKTVGVSPENISTDSTSGITIVVPCTSCTTRAMQPYMFQPQADGGGDFPTWSIESGSVPEGMTFYPITGVIGGNPGLPGSYTMQLRLTRTDGSYGVSRPFTITVIPPPTVTYQSTRGLVGRYAVIKPQVSGVVGKPLYVVPQGANPLPSGMQLDPATGVIQGNVMENAPGVVVMLNDSDGGSGSSQPFDVLTDKPSISWRLSPVTERVGVQDTVTPTLLNVTPAARVTLESGTLPPGLALDAPTGAISGAPTATGSWPNIVARVTDTGGTSVSGPLTINVVQPAIAYPSLVGWVGQPFLAAPQAQNLYPTGYSLVAGTLPAGLSLDPSTGSVVGKPTATGTAPGLQVLAADADGVQATSPAFSVQVLPPLSVTVPDPILARVGVPVSVRAQSANFTATPTWTGSGAFPAGIGLDAATGTLAGTPGVAGTFAGLTLTATQANGAATSSPFTIQVAPALALSYPAATTLARNRSASIPATVSGTVSAPAYALAAGTLPAGLSLSASTGAISGTPTTSVTQSGLQVRATDSGGSVTSAPFSITVAVPAASFAAVSTRAGDDFSQKGSVTAITSPSWTLAAGTLPDGLSLAADGTVSGKPTKVGTWGGIQLTATGTDFTATTPSFAISVTPALSAAMAPQDQAQTTHVGTTYTTSAATVQNAIGQVAWSIRTVSGATPPDARANADGSVTYTPSGSFTGQWTYALSASDAKATAGAGTATVTYVAPLAASAGNITVPPTGQVSSQLAATNASAANAVTWSWSGTQPPSWLRISGSTVTASPPATVAVGTYGPFTAQARDRDGSTANAQMSVFVVDTRPGISYPATVTAHVYTPFSVTPTVVNRPASAAYVTYGSGWPTWSRLDPANGTITLSPTAVGTSSGQTVLLSDNASGASGVSNPITFNAIPRMTVSMPQPPDGMTGRAYSTQRPTATNAIGTVRWTTDSQLPAGFSLDPTTGIVSGTTGSAQKFTLALTGTDYADGTTAVTPAYTYTIALDAPVLQVSDPAAPTNPSRSLSTIDFGSTTNGMTGASKVVTLYNKGTMPATGLTFQTYDDLNTTGDPRAVQRVFTVTDPGSCAQDVPPGGTCTFTLLGAGTANGSHTGTLYVKYGPLNAILSTPLAITTQNVIQAGFKLFTEKQQWYIPGVVSGANIKNHFKFRYLIVGTGGSGHGGWTADCSMTGGSAGMVTMGVAEINLSQPMFYISNTPPGPTFRSVCMGNKQVQRAQGVTLGSMGWQAAEYSYSSWLGTWSYSVVQSAWASQGDEQLLKGQSGGGGCTTDASGYYNRNLGNGSPGGSAGANGSGLGTAPCVYGKGTGSQPDFSMFKMNTFSWGPGGLPGRQGGPYSYRAPYSTDWIVGSGGAGGVLVNGAGPTAQSGVVVSNNPEAVSTGILNVYSGRGGVGYGAGGGGGSFHQAIWDGPETGCQYRWSAQMSPQQYYYCYPDYVAEGGDGARGFVYFEWDTQ